MIPTSKKFFFTALLSILLSDSKHRIFCSEPMPRLLCVLLERGLFNPTQFLILNSQATSSLKINGSVLLVLQMCMRLQTRFYAPDKDVVGLESIEQILALLEREYFAQLGTNPTHFVELLEASVAFYRVSKSMITRNIALKAACIALKYLTGQDKKATASFFTRVLPLLEDIVSGSVPDDESLSGLQSSLSSFFQSRGGLHELEKEFIQLLTSVNHESLLSVRSHLAAWRPETGSWQGQLLSWLMSPRENSEMKALVYRLSEQDKIQDRRAFFFNMFMVSVAQEQSAEAVSLLLLQLEHSGAYEHRNDHLYQQQTSFLSSLLVEMRGQKSFSRLLSIIVRLNFYLVRDELNHACLDDSEFLCGLIEASLLARQLPEIIQVLLQRSIALPEGCANTLKRISRPVLLEILHVLSSALQAEQTALVALEAATLLACYSSHPEDLAPLFGLCWERRAGLGAACGPFFLALFNRSPALRQKYADHETGIELVDGLLRPGMTRLSATSSIRLLPVVESSEMASGAIKLVLVETIINGSAEHRQLFTLAKFYECPAVRSALLPAIVNSLKEFCASSERISRLASIILLFPSGLFPYCPKETTELADRLTKLQNAVLLPTIAHLFSSPSVHISMNVLIDCAAFNGPAPSPSMESILSSALRQHSLGTVLSCLQRANMESSSWLRPIFAPSLCEAAGNKDRAAFEAFAMRVSPVLLSRVFMGDESASEAIEALASLPRVDSNPLALHLQSLLDENSSICWHPRLLRARIRLTVAGEDDALFEYLAKALCLPEDSGRTAHLVLERMSIDTYRQALLHLIRLQDPLLIAVVSDCLQRGLTSADKVKARFAFEAASHLIRTSNASPSSLRLAHRLVLAKSIRPLTGSEASSCLLIATISIQRNDDEEAVETAMRLLAGLQVAYWHLLRSMLPAYIGVLIGFHEHFVMHQESSKVALGLFTRLLGDLAALSGPGSGAIPFALPPLILQHVRLAIAHPEGAKALQAPILALLRHLDGRPVDHRQHQAPTVEHMERLQRLCHNRADERSLMARLLQEYRENIKYTGKA